MAQNPQARQGKQATILKSRIIYNGMLEYIVPLWANFSRQLIGASMSYNGWTNRETWLISVWFNPETKSDVDFARETIESDVENLPGYLKDFINVDFIDWVQLYDSAQDSEDDNEDND